MLHFVAGISPISSLLVGELFPLEFRGLGSSIATSFSYFCAFLSVKTFIDFQVCSTTYLEIRFVFPLSPVSSPIIWKSIFCFIFLITQELLGLHGAFWLYACISCCGLFFVVTCVPETKGKDLDEMDPKYAQTMTIHRWDMGTHVEYLV